MYQLSLVYNAVYVGDVPRNQMQALKKSTHSMSSEVG